MNVRAGAITASLLLLPAAACSRAESPPPGPRQVSEAFAAAYNARDAVRLAALYTDDAELMPPDSPVVQGRAAIEALFREKFEQNCAMELRSVRSDVAGGRGFDTGDIAITMSAPDGARERIAGKYLAVMTRVGNDWKIAYHMQTIVPD
ncbi:MAG TPA: SgcJ/EcaC family oxidoreductase [Vicinamibacterales bacterium]|nr:SgcJ/EcaC family oxidoreductase [Vicinamibacterales bacterium]